MYSWHNRSIPVQRTVEKGVRYSMEEKGSYSIEELFDALPITLVELGDRAKLNEVTVARIRDGKSSRRASVNRLLLVLSDVFKKSLSLKNVTGINVQVNKRKEAIQAREDAAQMGR